MERLSSKFANLQGLPSGLARRVVTESHAKVIKGKARTNVHLEDAGTEIASRLAGGRTPAPTTPSRKAAAKKAMAEAVKRWRAKKPEKYKTEHRAYMKEWRAKKRELAK